MPRLPSQKAYLTIFFQQQDNTGNVKLESVVGKIEKLESFSNLSIFKIVTTLSNVFVYYFLY